MGYDRRWLDEPHPGDHVGRSVWALGEILSTAWVPAVVGPTERLLDDDRPLASGRSVASHGSLRRPRARAPGPGPTRAGGPRAAERVLEQLSAAYAVTSAPGWLWFEDRLTYDNARLPHAMIAGGVALGRDDLTQTGLDVASLAR